MKTLFLMGTILLTAASAKAQDIITLKTGATINGKVAEVGINEIKHYKAENPQGPLYVTGKAEVAQITYANGVKDVFATTTTQQVSLQANVAVVPQQAPQTVIVERPYRRSRPYVYPVFVPHIDLGHHINLGHHNYGYGRTNH